MFPARDLRLHEKPHQVCEKRHCLQVSKSAIMAYVWDRAPDRDKLNEELCKLGFVGLMQQ